jgi:hypothetical protein
MHVRGAQQWIEWVGYVVPEHALTYTPPPFCCIMQVGDVLGIAATDSWLDQTEMANITFISDTTAATVVVGISPPLRFQHNGASFSYVHGSNSKTYTLDARAEVGDMTRLAGTGTQCLLHI